jgi:hypothetical protein
LEGRIRERINCLLVEDHLSPVPDAAMSTFAHRDHKAGQGPMITEHKRKLWIDAGVPEMTTATISDLLTGQSSDSFHEDFNDCSLEVPNRFLMSKAVLDC